MSHPFDRAGGSPADAPTVLVACSAGAEPDVVVQYGSGEVWYRRPRGAAGPSTPWLPLGAPPGSTTPGVAAGWTSAHGAAVVALGQTDQRVWTTTGSLDAPGWADLGRPSETGAYSVAAAEVQGGTGPCRLVALVTAFDELWLRLDPLDGSVPDPAAWEPITLPPPMLASRAVVLAAGAGADLPAGQVAVLMHTSDTNVGAVGVLIRVQGAWQWCALAPAPGFVDPFTGVLVTGAVTGAADVDGWVAVGGFDYGANKIADVLLLQRTGTSWTWRVVGQPTAEERGRPQAVAAGAVLVTAGGDSGAQLWRFAADGSWTLIGTPAPDTPVGSVATVDGAVAGGPSAIVAGAGRRVWAVRAQAAGTVWTELPPLPSTVAEVVGGLAEWFLDISPDPGFHLVVVGSDGLVRSRLWDATTWVWRSLGLPAPGVPARAGVGTLRVPGAVPSSHVVVLGSDDGIWRLSRSSEQAWSWTAHGRPGDGPVRATAPPVLRTGDPQPQLVAWGHDGQVWVWTDTELGRRWTSRGTPAGATVFGLVGAAAAPGPAGESEGLLVVVITDDGAVWASWGHGAEGSWTPLGRPGPALAAAAGVAVVPVLAAPEGPVRVRLLVLDGVQRHLRALTWPPPAGPLWTDVLPPPGVGIAGSFGGVPDPADPSRAIVYVEGSDRHLWALLQGATASSWQDRGPLPGTGRVRGRAVLAGMVDRSPSWRVYPVAAVCADGSLSVAWQE